MPNISSETLFHFTSKPEYLFQILEHEFRPRYYQEIIKLDGLKTPFNNSIPMVCFCDIPLSQIKNHIETYGDYGIGMTKKWAVQNKLNPVLYLEPKSKLTKSILSVLRSQNGVDKNQQKQGVFNIFRYMKNYEGDFFRDGKILENIKFYNEREWRHVPDITPDMKFWLTEVEFRNKTILADNNSIAEKYNLTFQPEDIKYIIIKNETEISAMIHALKRIKSKYTPEIIENLVSRIITTDQIKKDF